MNKARTILLTITVLMSAVFVAGGVVFSLTWPPWTWAPIWALILWAIRNLARHVRGYWQRIERGQR